MVTAAIRRSVWHTATRRVGPQFLAKVLNYYRFNPANKRDFINAYSKYLNALNNTNNAKAKANARAAGIKFTNTLFKIYNKEAHRSNPVANGFTNGVQASVVYWMPGVLFRRAIGHRRARSAPTPRSRSKSM